MTITLKTQALCNSSAAYPSYTFAGRPRTPKPVTRKTDPVIGYFSLSSFVDPCTPHVTYSSSKFFPPKQHEVVLLAGMSTVFNCLPARLNI